MNIQSQPKLNHPSRRSLRGLVFSLLLFTSGCESMPELGQILNAPTGTGTTSTETIASGLREALEVGSQRAVSQLGRPDGFLNSPFHIPLPDTFRQAQDVAGRFGFASIFDEMEVKLNRAAEAAAPKAQRLFIGSIRQLTFADVMAIYRGGDDAATQYLERTTAADLRLQMRPIVDDSLRDVGALSTFKSLADQYNRLPLVTPIDADLSRYVVDHASRALFTQIAAEEAAIRENPAKRSSELLRRVFGENLTL